MKVKGDIIIFETTGRRDYANNGIIGIDPELNTFGGYDGSLETKNYKEYSKEEKKELAEFMIGLWTKYANEQDGKE